MELFFSVFFPTILLSCTFPLRAPLSVPWKQWLHKLAQCHPCSFHCLILQIPSLTLMSGKQLYGSTRKWSFLYSTVFKPELLKFAAGGWFNIMIDIMVFHTIHVITTPLFIFRHFSFWPLSAIHENVDSPLFSFCSLVSGITFFLSKGDRTSFFPSFCGDASKAFGPWRQFIFLSVFLVSWKLSRRTSILQTFFQSNNALTWTFTSTDTCWTQGETSGCHGDRGCSGQINRASGKYAEASKAEQASPEWKLHDVHVLRGYMWENVSGLFLLSKC